MKTEQKNYVYRFLDENFKVIYIGKTTNIDSRMKQHFGNNGHLLNECYEKVCRVDYIELKTKLDMDIKELYYIGKLNPKYNSMNNGYEVTVEINEAEDSWATYTHRKSVKSLVELEYESEINKKEEKIKELENNLNEMKNKFKKMSKEFLGYEQEVSRLKMKEENMKMAKSMLATINTDEAPTFTTKEAKMLINSGYTNTLYDVFRGKIRAMLYKKGDEIIARHYDSESKDHSLEFKNNGYDEVVIYSTDSKREFKSPYSNSNRMFLNVEISYLNNWCVLPEDSSLLENNVNKLCV